jgi:hypothetical protein
MLQDPFKTTKGQGAQGQPVSDLNFATVYLYELLAANSKPFYFRVNTMIRGMLNG